jgi:hypothetical protein
MITYKLVILLHNGALHNTGTPPLMQFFGTQKNRVKGKPRYRRTILVLKQENFFTSKVHFLTKIFYKAKKAALPKVINILEWKYNLMLSERFFLHIKQNQKIEKTIMQIFFFFCEKSVLDRIITWFLV